MFTKYEKSSNDTKILLIYLLLNGLAVNQVKRLEEVEESRLFGLKVKKVYGITPEYIDCQRIEKEIEAIQSPIVCSRQTFEYYCDERVIYTYKARQEDSPLWINDMGVVSKVMVIEEDCVITSNKAKSMSDTTEFGFMYFYDYVLKEECEVGKWHITYSNKVLSVYYKSDNDDTQSEELLFSAIEIDKTSTYKLVLYIIKKASLIIEEWLGDNYEEQEYTLIK